MWAEYAKDDEGIVIKSTVEALTRSLVQSLKNKWWIGRVSYVDLGTYEGMDIYEGNQAHLRAFLPAARTNAQFLQSVELFASGECCF